MRKEGEENLILHREASTDTVNDSTLGIHSVHPEECTVRQFCPCVSTVEYTDTNRDGAASYTPRLWDSLWLLSCKPAQPVTA